MPTQTTYVYNPTTYGLEFTTSQTWTIAEGVFVGSGSVYGVYNQHGGGELVNKGRIYSAENSGVVFEGNNNTIVNKAGAEIVGVVGVYLQNQHEILTNHGSIVGYINYGVWAYDTSHFVLNNDGEIYGHTVGVDVQSVIGGLAGATIDNSGLIHSDEYGIFVDTDAGETTTIVNEHGGTIKGAAVSISAASGRLSVENHGTIKGGIFSLGAASDKVVNDGHINGYLFLGPGDDMYKNAGGKAGLIYGGPGDDTLVAGPHTDKFVFDSPLNAATNVDTIKHFDPGKDMLFLDQTIFTMLTGPGSLKGSEFHIGKHAGDANDYIIYNKHTGALYYDEDGNGTGAPKVQFAQVEKGLNLQHDDFTVIA
jgi:hypothetical protein